MRTRTAPKSLKISQKTGVSLGHEFTVAGTPVWVDFHWEVNGKMYNFSIPGGGFVSLEHVVEVLGIAGSGENGGSERDVSAENAENAGEIAPEDGNEFVGEVLSVDESGENGTENDTAYEEAIKLNEVQVSEATKKFVADVESVEFSTPELVDVSKVEADTTVGAIKRSRGLEVEYSADLSDEQISEINSSTVGAGDWALISVRAFDTVESLTVTMKNGDVFTAKVTDEQIDQQSQLVNGNQYVLYTISTATGYSRLFALRYDGKSQPISDGELNTLGWEYLWTYHKNGDDVYWTIGDNYLDAWSEQELPVHTLGSDGWYPVVKMVELGGNNGGYKIKDKNTDRYIAWSTDKGFYMSKDDGNRIRVYRQNRTPATYTITYTQNNVNFGSVYYNRDSYTRVETSDSNLTIVHQTGSNTDLNKQSYNSFTAVPVDNYHLVKWSVVDADSTGSVVSWGNNDETETSLTIKPIVSGNVTIKAEFAPTGYPYVVKVNDLVKGQLEAYMAVDDTHHRGGEISLYSGEIDEDEKAANAHVIIAKNNNGYFFDHWELRKSNGTIINANYSENNTLEIGDVEFAEPDMELVAVFDGSGPSVGSSGQKISEAEKRKLLDWLTHLNENIPLGDTAKKTAEVYDYENRIYKISLEGKSTLKSLDGSVGLGLLLDVSASMKFPSKVYEAFGTGNHFPMAYLADSHATQDNNTNQTIVTIDNGDGTQSKYYFDRTKDYYVIADADNTATMWKFWWNGSKWRCVDASKLKTDTSAKDVSSGSLYSPSTTQSPATDLPIYLATDILTQEEYNANKTICDDLGLTVGSAKNRAYYLQKTLDGTLDTLKEIIEKIQLAKPGQKNPDIKIAWNVFAKLVGGKSGSYYNTTFTTVQDKTSINLNSNSYDYSGGTSTDRAFYKAYNSPTDSGAANGSAYRFDWENVDYRYAILITDGAPQRDGKNVDKEDVIKAAQKVVDDKDIDKIITVGLSMDSVEIGRSLLGDLADITRSEGEARLFFEAESGDDLEYVLYKIIQAIMKDAIIQSDVVDTIDAVFYPVDETGMPLISGAKINLDGSQYTQSDAAQSKPYGTLMKNNDGTWNVTWEKQDMTADGWRGSVLVKAKEDFLGGNAIETNVGKASITPRTFRVNPGEKNPPELKDQTANYLDTPLVNVDELRVNPNETAWTVYLHTEINPLEELARLLLSDTIDLVVTDVDNDPSPGSNGLIVDLPLGNSASNVLMYGEPIASTGANPRARDANKTPAQISVGDLLGITTLEQAKQIVNQIIDAGGSKTYPYSYISNGSYMHDTGMITLTLNKIGETASYEAHIDAPVGHEVEAYTLSFTYEPYETSNNNTSGYTKDLSQWHNGTGQPGAPTGTMDGTNIHTVNVFVKGLQITKKDQAFTNTLTGAEFVLYRTVRATDDTSKLKELTVNGKKGDYYPVTTLDMSSSGVATIDEVSALKEGEQYYLVETKAPTGYIALEDPIPVNLTITNSYTPKPNGIATETKPASDPYDWTQTATLTLGASSWIKRTDSTGETDLTQTGLTADSENETMYYEIANNAGVELPATGGPGTNLIYLLGIMMLALAGGGLVMKRRRAS